MVCITVLFGLPAFAPSLMHPWFSALLLGVAASIALMLTVPRTPGSLGLAIATAVGLVAGATAFPRAALLVSVLLPTVAHVFVFTASFMLVGALRTGSRAAYLSVIAFLAGAASFLIPDAALSHAALVPPGTTIVTGLSFFEPIVESLRSMGLSSSTDKHLFGFLSFAYTYHYLNWFSKAKVIQWNRIPRTRGRVIAAIYAVTIALYAYSFTAGFLVSALLSNLHVLLEFPLNLRTFGTLLRQGGRLKIGLPTKAP